MAATPLPMQMFALEGEVVEILEDHGRRFAKIVFTEPVVLDVSGEGADGAHLGERGASRGWMGFDKEAP